MSTNVNNGVSMNPPIYATYAVLAWNGIVGLVHARMQSSANMYDMFRYESRESNLSHADAFSPNSRMLCIF